MPGREDGYTMFLTTTKYENSLPGGTGSLEVAGEAHGPAPRLMPLTTTRLTGSVTGPLASLRLEQVFSVTPDLFSGALEAIYRFPLPGDSLLTACTVMFGDERLTTRLVDADTARDEYHKAYEEGRQGALLTREAPDIFTLHLTGIVPGQDVTVTTDLLLYGEVGISGTVFRFPLTLAPRYVRRDEFPDGRDRAGPLTSFVDPGHTVSIDLLVAGDGAVRSYSHTIRTDRTGEGTRVRFMGGEVRPDGDFVMRCLPETEDAHPWISCTAEICPSDGYTYLLTTVHPPVVMRRPAAQREIVVLVDHSGSMEGPKWKAADWAVKKLLRSLGPGERFNLGVFHTYTTWLSANLTDATEKTVSEVFTFLDSHTDSGGTELGPALQQAFSFQKTHGKFSRHVIIITDAQVTDEGRLVRIIRDEQKTDQPRRVSVISIDAAPHTPLVQEMTRVGMGLARYLTSDPNEEDITTALLSVLSWWQQPSVKDAALRFSVTTVEPPDGPAYLGPVPVPDLCDTPVTLVHRVPSGEAAINVGLEVGGQGKIMETIAVPASCRGVRALFGSVRIRTLEQIGAGFYQSGELSEILLSMGYQANGRPRTIDPDEKFPELFLDEVILTESLRFKIPSKRTALICTGSRTGSQVRATVGVPVAIPAGWKTFSGGIQAVSLKTSVVPGPGPAKSGGSGRRGFLSRLTGGKRSHAGATHPADPKASVQTFWEISGMPDPGNCDVLFDGPLPGWKGIGGIELLIDISFIPFPDFAIELFLTSRERLLATITYEDFRDVGVRPLNIAIGPKDRLIIRIVGGWDGGMLPFLKFRVYPL